MPNIAPEWQPNADADAIVATLINTYQDKLGHIDASQIACVQITNKDRPDSAKWFARLASARPPVLMFCNKPYVIYFHQDTWDMFNAPQRSMLILEMLLRIPEEMDGTILQDDLKGIKALIARFGVDFYDDPELPDVAESRQEF
jgi:hypothetical protein